MFVRPHPLALLVCALCLAGPACGGGDEGTADEAGDSQESAEAGEASETGEAVAPGDDCEAGALGLDSPSTTRASLAGATPSPVAAACGIDGPVVFFDLHLAGRVDLTTSVRGREAAPRFALMRPGCLDSGDDPSRVLACGDALPLTLFDLGPGLELSLALGLTAEDPALDLDPDDFELDPLEFELELVTRAVLAEGEACDLPNTRCEPGTVCIRAAQLDPDTGGDETGGDELDELRCLRPEADSCGAPGALELELGVVHEIVIEPDEPHSDAHEHPCTGWRRVERVEQLSLPPDLPPGSELRVRADDGRVGLALRGPSCLVEDALACAAAGAPDETFLVWGGEALAAAAAGAQAPLLFIELPRSDRADPPLEAITVRVEIVPS